MRIECPQCGFARDIPDDKLPAGASRATCPKCQHKFRFRDAPASAEPDGLPDLPPPPVQPVPQADIPAADAQAAPAPGAPPPKPPIALVPKAAREQPQAQAEEDIWRRLESMSKGDRATTGGPGRDEDIPPDLTIPPPWEDQKKYGPVGGLIKTIRLVMLQPTDFFSYMPLGGGYRAPVLFYLIVGGFQTLVQYLWLVLGMTPANLFPQLQQPDATPAEFSVKSLALLVLIAPAMLGLALGLIAGVNHMLLTLVRGANRGFEATLRGVAYGVAPLVLAAIPYVGDVIGALWSVCATLIAFKCLHRTEAWRAVLAFLLPLILASVAAVFMVLARG